MTKMLAGWKQLLIGNGSCTLAYNQLTYRAPYQDTETELQVLYFS